MLSTEEIEKLLQSLQDAATPEEQQQILDVLANQEEALQQYLEQGFHAETHAPAANPDQKETTYQQLLQRTGQEMADRTHGGSGMLVRSVNWKRFARVAAAVLLIGGGSLAMWRAYRNQPAAQVLAQTTSPAPAPVIMDTLFNHGHRVLSQSLPDGSTVALAPGSYASYRRDFAHHKKVYLQGTGTFTVKNDPVHPFSVTIGNLEVKDLGTIFSIHDAPDAVKVKLLKGKVLIHSLKEHPAFLQQDMVMKPGELFRMDKLRETYTVSKPERTETPARIRPAAPVYNLNFQNAGLASVFKALEAKFGQPIIYKPAIINDKLFTGDLANQSNIENAVRLICISNNLQYEVKGDSIIIH